MPIHRELSASEIHPPGYIQDADPGAVGAGKVWVDTSAGTGKWILKIRNTTDTGWELANNPPAGQGYRIKDGFIQLWNPMTNKYHSQFCAGPEGAVATSYGPGES